MDVRDYPLPSHVANASPDIYLAGSYVVLDFETTNLSKGNPAVPENRLVLGSYYSSNTRRLRTIVGTEYDMTALVLEIEQADFLVAHNAKMELGWLRRAGLDLRKVVVYDTMIAEYVLAGNDRVQLSLGAMAPAYGLGTKAPFIDALLKGGVCPSEMPSDFLQRRCELDVMQTNAIFIAQLPKLNERGLMPVMYTRCLLTPCLADMESRGMCLDVPAVKAALQDASIERAELARDLTILCGGANLRSPKQKLELLYTTLKFKKPRDRFGKEITSTDADAIKLLRPTNARQREFIEKYSRLTELNSLISKNLLFFNEVADRDSPVFVAQFNQTIARTHRLTSSGVPLMLKGGTKTASVQLQNMPRQLKRLFKSRTDGWLISETDGAQLEFRVAGFMGQDPVAYASLEGDEDVHSFTASVLTAGGQPTSRQDAKAHTFKPLYGGMSGSPAEVTYYKAFKSKYHSITQTQEAWKSEVLRTGKLVLPTGLIFYWPDTTVTKTGYITNSTNICNYPVQSLATADIIPIALVCLWHRSKDLQSFIVNTIHDSVISEVHPDEVAIHTGLSQHCFTDDVYAYLDRVYDLRFNFPLGTGTKTSRNWSVASEEVLHKASPPYPFNTHNRNNT